MRDYDPKLDTVERWGEEAFNHILATGKVDDWTHEVDDGHWEGQIEMTPPLTEASRKSLMYTIGQQGEEMEQLMTEREDLKSEIADLRTSNTRARFASLLFGSVVLILALVIII